MSFVINLTKEISAETNLGKIRLFGLKNFPQGNRKAIYERLSMGRVEIETQIIRQGQANLKSLGAVIHKELDGLHFPIPAEIERAREAWDIFLDIRPLMVSMIKQSHLNR